jgi:hypothetical protein
MTCVTAKRFHKYPEVINRNNRPTLVQTPDPILNLDREKQRRTDSGGESAEERARDCGRCGKT